MCSFYFGLGVLRFETGLIPTLESDHRVIFAGERFFGANRFHPNVDSFFVSALEPIKLGFSHSEVMVERASEAVKMSTAEFIKYSCGKTQVYRVHGMRDGRLIGARSGRCSGDMNVVRQAELLKRPDTVPVEVNLVPFQAVARADGMRMMIVMPALSPREEGDPPTVGGVIAGNEAARAPGVRGGIHEPCGMQANDGAQENSPKQKRETADREQDDSEGDHGHVIVFRDPDVELVLGEVGDVASERGRVVVHGLAHENPAHVGPPLSIHGRVRIAFVVGKLVMHAMRGDPENRAAFKSERGANGEDIFDPLGSFVAAMREQTMVAHANSKAAGYPPQEDGHEQCFPGEEEKSGDSSEVKQDKSECGDPIYAMVESYFLDCADVFHCGGL